LIGYWLNCLKEIAFLPFTEYHPVSPETLKPETSPTAKVGNFPALLFGMPPGSLTFAHLFQGTPEIFYLNST